MWCKTEKNSREKTLRFKKIPGWRVDEVLETASVDGAASFFLTVYIISSSVCPSDQF